ncbi:MAG: T9SS type A sorting domain-containing protein [Candidatus Cloacimonadales bacterium]|nr:T9SS type A sorting domain-containing protein [Candidatus Cloacimonadota bacterium]MDD3501677.1 T9SS type A sorting domain-containing protein [Candidatus Cloacimonadota bacterium]MDX9978189.1 T9SS type A sorting domain-containing protein [Candidatus Cloacimonadales bacterium]
MNKYILIVLCLILSISLFSQTIEINQNDTFYNADSTNTRTQTLGCSVPSLGTFKILVILIDWAGETNQSSVWPLNGNPENYNQFLDSQPHTPNTQWVSNNISKYTYTLSNGLYQVIGDVYRVNLPINTPFANMSSPTQLAFQMLDPLVDYSQYDNWNNYSNSYSNIQNIPDGRIDFCLAIFRSSFSTYVPNIQYSGIAGIPSYTTQDTKIVNGVSTSIRFGSGSTQGGYINGFQYIQALSFHEFAHYLFTTSNGAYGHLARLAEISSLNANQVGWGNKFVSMTAWEKERLGWISYNTVTTDQIITLSDFMTSFTAVKIPTSIPNRHYIIENRQGLHEYDTAFGHGLYIYRAQDEGGLSNSLIYENIPQHVANLNWPYDGCINLLSADGRYIFTTNLSANQTISSPSLLRITKGAPHPRGYDERDYCGQFNGNSRYYCINIPSANAPWYTDPGQRPIDCHPYGDAFGDNFDGFSLGFNKVFSKWTNPGIDPVWSPNTNFSVEILSENAQTGAVSFRIRFINPEEAPLPRPMGLKVSNQGIAYDIQWYQPNTTLQPGFSHYNVYYKTNINPTWRLLTSTTSTNLQMSIPFDTNPNVATLNRKSYFRVTSVKNNGNESNFSDQIMVDLNQNITISSLSIPQNYTVVVDDSMSVIIDEDMTMNENSSLILGTGSQIIINPDATLNIASNSVIQGTNRTQGDILGSRIIVNGNLTVGDNVSFTSDNGSWDGIEINSINPITLNNANFVNADLYTNRDVNITNSTFDNSTIYQRHSSLSISNSQFVKSCVNAFTKVQGVSTMIKNSTFDGNMDMEAIQLNSIEKYSITENTINNYGIGISLYETTFGYIEKNQISDNRIGIQMYHAGANITNANIVENNDYGIVAYRKSLWSLEGSKSAPYQKIINNKYAQVLFSYDSAPEYAEFNQIYKSVYSAKPLVTCTNVPTNPKKIIFTNNYFGSNFDPKYNLEPNDIYDYSSAWEPEIDLGNLSTIPETYKSAKESEKNGNYTEAKEIMLSFYSAVPDSSILLDKSSKQLLALEKLTSLNYSELTSFYQSYNGQDSEIINLFDYLQNCCALNLNEYQTAISWLETQITDPITQLDSLFATIDIAYIYLLMENKRSANIVSNMEYLKPSSFSSFSVNRMQLLNDLLFDDGVNENNQSSQVIKEINLFQNYPNPANPSTTISFILPEDSNIELSIFNVKGQKVKTLQKEYLSKGTHNTIWEGNDSNNNKVASGIYFYRLITKGQTYTKKMILMK